AGHRAAKQYVMIELQTGTVRPLTDAPISSDGGWPADGSPVWANDDKTVLLPGTFIRSETGKPLQPCAAVVDVPNNKITCVEVLEAHNDSVAENDHPTISSVQFMQCRLIKMARGQFARDLVGVRIS